MILPPSVLPMFEKGAIPLTLADVTQPDHPIVLANAAFCKLVEYALDEVLGRNCRFLQTEDCDPAARSEARTLIETGREGVVRLRNRKRSGQVFDLLLFLHPVTGGNGRLRYFLGSQYAVGRQPTHTPEPHAVALGDIIGEANKALSDSRLLVTSSLQIMADVNANLIRRALARM